MRIAVAAGCLLVACQPYDPPRDRDGAFAECCQGAGVCAPEALLARSEAQQLDRDSCGEALLCIPRRLTEGDRPRLAACTYAATGGEGRCAPVCLPMVSQMADRLSRDDCEERSTVCVPCFDPSSGVATGICSLGEDPGPSETPHTFEPCCGRAGRCIPASLVPEASRDRLGRDACEEDALCTPVTWVRDPTRVPRSCEVASTGAEGRCLSRCLPEVGERAGLHQDDCRPGEKCVPCYDPIDGDDTGACTIGDDRGPVRPKVTFAGCCGDAGRCVPDELVSAEQRERLDRDECEAEAAVCTPLTFLRDPEAAPAGCTASLGGVEGRCLPACLPEVARRAGALRRDDCAAGELCVPCFDPVDGEATGACEFGGDPGPHDPPRVFPSCCEDRGRCVPEGGLTTAQRSQLGRDVCEDEAALCAPLALMDAPVDCTVGATGGTGRCLPACFPEVARRRRGLAQDGCPDHQLCAPCVDPITGDSTGACSSEREQAAPVTFEHCCEERGRCVPAHTLSDAQRAQLGADTCSNAAAVCAPLTFLEDPAAIPASCSASATGGEGRCLPSCLPAVASRGDALKRDGCGEFERCVPCFDPVNGEPTGACALGADPGPREPKVVFDACCRGDGRCVPPELVAPGRRAAIGGADCPADDALCVPAGFLAADFVPKTCRDPQLGAEGRCLSACLSSVERQLDRLERADCAASERCVPCFDPIDGEPTGACSLAPADPGPREPAALFEPCCGSGEAALGLCVPAELVPAGAPELSRQSCRDADHVCAPRLLVEDPNARPPACDPAFGSDGVCLPECMLTSSQRSLTSQGDCARAHVCAPCSALPESTSLCR